jgi:hypothetical protein
VTGIGLRDGQQFLAVDLEASGGGGAQRGLDDLVPVQHGQVALPFEAGSGVLGFGAEIGADRRRIGLDKRGIEGHRQMHVVLRESGQALADDVDEKQRNEAQRQHDGGKAEAAEDGLAHMAAAEAGADEPGAFEGGLAGV